MNKLGPCLCPDFSANVSLINAPFATEYARNPNTYRGYTGKPFKFCPWCGSELQGLVVIPNSATSTQTGE